MVINLIAFLLYYAGSVALMTWCLRHLFPVRTGDLILTMLFGWIIAPLAAIIVLFTHYFNKVLFERID